MKLKKFSDFSMTDELDELDKTEDIILEKKDDDKDIDLKEKIGEGPEETEEEKKDDKNPAPKNAQSEKEEEKKKDEELDEKFEIEILEDNIIKFNNGKVKKIYELLSEKYTGMDYFIRKKNNNLHVVKYNESLNLNINNFVDSLFKFYSTKKELKPLAHNIKIKGNDKFSVVENINPHAIDRVANDISKLLSKKK